MKYKKNIVIFLMILIFCFAPTKKSLAWYGETTANFAADKVYKEIKSVITTALQQAAIEMINDTVDNLISGVTQAGTLFITDWEDYLFNEPALETHLFMNDFFAITSRGRSSDLNYRSGCGRNYTQWRNARALKNTELVVDFSGLESDFEDEACSVAEAFSKGTWGAVDAMFDPGNNPIGYDLYAQGVEAKKREKAEAEAMAKGISYQGFKGTTGGDGETIITPGIITKDIKSNTLDVSNKSLANADSPGEVVGSFVAKIVGSVIRQGIGNMQKQVQAKINEKICEGSQNIYDELGNLVPEQDAYSGMGSLGRTKKSGRCMIR